MTADWIRPDWPAPARVRALSTTRCGGVGGQPYDSLNLGTHVGDEPAHVAANRARLAAVLPSEPAWLSQVHGVAVADAASLDGKVPDADASIETQHNEDPADDVQDSSPEEISTEEHDDTESVHTDSQASSEQKQ